MTALDRCLERIAHLDRAAHLLNEVRFYNSHLPVREAFARHRVLLGEARRHLESAASLRGEPG